MEGGEYLCFLKYIVLLSKSACLFSTFLAIRRSMRYNSKRHKTEIGTTKRKKIRTVDFCDTLATLLRKA